MPNASDPSIVIRVTIGGRSVRIGWNGAKWVPMTNDNHAAELCKLAQVVMTTPSAGSHHLPPAVWGATRVAEAIGGKIIKCPQWPAGSLPAGAIS